jgi:hypothetical protein
MSNKIYAPFTKEQADMLNARQKEEEKISQKFGDIIIDLPYPAYTCCSTTNTGEECKRAEHEDGYLIAQEGSGWTCACGKYTQDWAHAL